MKKIIIGIVIGLLLSISSVASVSASPPYSILIDAGSGNKPVFNIDPDTDGISPPEITIILPNCQMIKPGPPK